MFVLVISVLVFTVFCIVSFMCILLTCCINWLLYLSNCTKTDCVFEALSKYLDLSYGQTSYFLQFSSHFSSVSRLYVVLHSAVDCGSAVLLTLFVCQPYRAVLHSAVDCGSAVFGTSLPLPTFCKHFVNLLLTCFLSFA